MEPSIPMAILLGVQQAVEQTMLYESLGMTLTSLLSELAVKYQHTENVKEIPVTDGLARHPDGQQQLSAGFTVHPVIAIPGDVLDLPYLKLHCSITATQWSSGTLCNGLRRAA